MLRYALLFCAALPTFAVAEDIDTSVDFNTLDRGDFVNEARRLGEASWEGSMALFSRIDPSIADLVPEFPWGNDFETAYGCVYDDMSASGNLNDYNLMRDEGVKFISFLDANPDVTIFNIDQYDEALDLMTPSDVAIKSMQDCGLMDLNQQAMIDSGLMQSVMRFYAQQEQAQ